jgi:Tfp pilus assembly protein PilF
MRTSRIALALVIALAPGATCLVSTPAAAQSGVEDPITAMARARFKEGVDFYDKGEYEQARASFLQAYALKKHPAVLLNLAWSCVKSGHALEGKKYFEQFLSEGKDITDKQRADANDGLTQAKAKLGRIEVQATSGTDVTIDGDHVGTAPLSDAVVVEAGAHTVKFKGADGSTDTQSISVLGGQKAVAKFPQTGSGAGAVALPPTAATNAPSSPPDTSPPTTPPPTADQAAKPPDATKEAPSSHKSNLLAPPNNIVPALAFAGVAVAGFATAGIFAAIKGSAQSNADSVAAQIVQNGGGSTACNAPPPGSKFANACNAYTSDLNDVNQDATSANIGIGVGVAGIIGFAVYWVLADKSDSSALLNAPVVTPMVGRSTGGLALSGHF